MRPLIYYLPILTTIIAIVFAVTIYRRYLQRGRRGNHLLWWSIGALTYSLGAFSESYITLLGLNPVIFKFWYIFGALLGGAPLATGTVWFLLRPVVARRWTIALIIAVTIPAILAILSPVDLTVLDPHLPGSRALVWWWVRIFSPFINTYAMAFLVGGAVLSALRYLKVAGSGDGEEAELARDRVVGNSLIAFGAILPGAGGLASRLGHTEILYILELAGIILIWLGYWFNIRRQPVDKFSPTQV